MNGIHDMGGLHGFGKVEVEPNEPVFHERWESRVFGIAQSTPRNIDAGRHSIERLDPVRYLQHGYFGRWLAAMERTLRDLGVITADELKARMKELPPATSQGREPARSWRPVPRSYLRPLTASPAFSAGQTVKTRNHQPAGHTRLPAYVRCRRGTIVKVHPAMVFPDDHAMGLGENPQFLYTVRFAGSELWGPTAETATFVYVDLFEGYLEADAVPAQTKEKKARARRSAAAR